jgi:hypothetical protein
MEKFLEEAKKMAYSEVEKTGMPVKLHVDLATEKGKEIAKKLGANENIVEAGTLLMDCLIGQALKENRPKEHIQMSLEKTNELLNVSDLTDEEKENIRHCVLEHHGVEKFYSLESEICCNADCYRFTSVKGFFFYVRNGREMSFEELVKLLKLKVEEKWHAISLDYVRKELESEHEVIVKILENLEK